MVRVQAEDFDIASELAFVRDRSGPNTGAVVSFAGLVREFAGSMRLSSMTLEYYPGMTERQLGQIDAEACQRWPLSGSLIVHRHGRLEPGDNIVLVVTASAHRKAAFEAAEFLVDWLKTRAPFWKQEATARGPRWVAARADDDDAAARWRARLADTPVHAGRSATETG